MNVSEVDSILFKGIMFPNLIEQLPSGMKTPARGSTSEVIRLLLVL